MPKLSPQTNLYYCGQPSSNLQGSNNGFCGPNNGPQCEDCKRYQATFFPGSFPNVMLDSSKLPAATQYASTSSTSSYQAMPQAPGNPTTQVATAHSSAAVGGMPWETPAHQPEVHLGAANPTPQAPSTQMGPTFKGICCKCGGNVMSSQERGKDQNTGQYYHSKCPAIEQSMDRLQVGDEPLHVHMQKLQGEVQTLDGKPKKSFITGKYYCGLPTNFANLQIPDWDGNCGPGDEAPIGAVRVQCVSCDAYAKSLKKKAPTYIAKPKDDSLMAYLDCLFTLIEFVFENYDKDDAKAIMFSELQRLLAKKKYYNTEELKAIYQIVDEDNSGSLDFPEFMQLLVRFYWKYENLDYFFQFVPNREVACKAVDRLHHAFKKYSTDKDHALTSNQLRAFFENELPQAVSSGVFDKCIKQGYHDQDGSGSTSFKELMRLMNIIVCSMPNCGPRKLYVSAKVAPDDKFKLGKGEKSQFWMELVWALSILEADFKNIDKDSSGTLEIKELADALPEGSKNDNLEFYSRLEKAMQLVDLDGSRNLDFYEFLYLGYHMSMEGPYTDMCPASKDPGRVKKCFIDIRTFFHEYDKAKVEEITKEQLGSMVSDVFGEVPATFNSCWDESMPPNRSAMDPPRLIKFFYLTVKPKGCFHPSIYKPNIIQTIPTIVSLPTIETTQIEPKRINPVIVSKFKRGKLLGKGGQGTVHLGTYDGEEVAGKTFSKTPGPALIKECEDEVKFFAAIKHPNCHHLLGAKTTLDNGGIIMLTEVCAEGSLFDFYRSQKAFDMATKMRIAKECCRGMKAIHDIGYMHRDIKGQNIFLDTGMIAKVADFGMCTNDATSTVAGGTPQWMAPEVLQCFLRKPTVYDKKVDVYSQAILLWEIFHLQVPYFDVSKDTHSLMCCIVSRSLRPRINQSKCPPPVTNLMQRMWAADPKARPSMSQVVDELEPMQV